MHRGWARVGNTSMSDGARRFDESVMGEKSLEYPFLIG